MTQGGSDKTHRALEHLLAWSRRLPKIWQQVDDLRSANAKLIGGPDWPSYCYLPMQPAGVLVAALMKHEGHTPNANNVSHPASIIATLSAWRMTQGIYRFDPTVYAALIDSPIDGTLPAALGRHLPEWCVYIETPSLTMPTQIGEVPLRGTFVWLDRDKGSDHDILTFALDADGLPLTISHVPLVGTIQEALERTTADWRDAYVRGNATSLPPAGFEALALQALTPLVSLVLYLCSEAADIVGPRDRPSNSEPALTLRSDMPLFAADRPTLWEVGARLGAALPKDCQREPLSAEPDTDRGVRTHARRVH